MTNDALRNRAISGLGGRLIGGLLSTAHFSTGGVPGYRDKMAAGQTFMFLIWHWRLLPLSYYHRTWNLVTLISQSRDGEYIARVVERWGYSVVRGSSSRGGGQAARQLVRQVRAGRSIVVTPDGPRGPRERVKPGIVTAARLAGCPLVPASASASRAWWFEGWDRFMVPKPFARIHMVYGEPIDVPRDAGEAAIARIVSTAEDELNRLTRVADRHVGS
jgi:lysophospholipid acyltransferase (LPLAT)-like uncharacterized protein